MRPLPSLAPVVLALLLAGCETSVFNFPERSVDVYEKGVWLKEGVNEEQRRADIAECRRVAAAQVARDERIDEDIGASDMNRGAAQGSEELLESMQAYGYEQREQRLFIRCMQGKGYKRD